MTEEFHARLNRIAYGLVVVAIFGMALLFSQSGRDQKREVAAALGRAGYTDAYVMRRVRLDDWRRCGIRQIKKPGRLYRWRSETASGLYCAPRNGPHRILVDGR